MKCNVLKRRRLTKWSGTSWLVDEQQRRARGREWRASAERRPRPVYDLLRSPSMNWPSLHEDQVNTYVGVTLSRRL